MYKLGQLHMLLFFILQSYYLKEAISNKIVSINKLTKVGKLNMSPIGIGTWSWGNRLLWQYKQEDDVELKQAYEYSLQQGINWFDTADSYGTGTYNGRSEELLGNFMISSRTTTTSLSLFKLSQKTNQNPYFCTKLAPYPWRVGSQSMITAANQSINRLQKPIDMLQLHWPPSLQWQETAYLKAFAQLVDEKQATQIGLSNFGPKGLTRVYKTLNSFGHQPYSNQVQFSLLSRYPLTSSLKETCDELNVQLIGYSPLALGLLTDKYNLEKNVVPTGLRGILCREYLPAIQPLLNELRSLAKAKGKTVSQVVLNWNIQKGFLVLVGARNVQQVNENLGALGWSLKPNEVEAIDLAASKIKKQLVQNSFQSN